ncbi:MAG: hypothetical protein ACPG2Y_00110 [Acholeplasmataceae bacterium]
MPPDLFDEITEEIDGHPKVTNHRIATKYYLNGYLGCDLMEDVSVFSHMCDWNALVSEYGNGLLDQFLFCKFKNALTAISEDEKNIETETDNGNSNENTDELKPEWLNLEELDRPNIWARLLFPRDQEFNLDQWLLKPVVLEIGLWCFRYDWIDGVDGAFDAASSNEFIWDNKPIDSITELSTEDAFDYRCNNAEIIYRYLDYDPREWQEKVQNHNLQINAPPPKLQSNPKLLSANKNKSKKMKSKRGPTNRAKSVGSKNKGNKSTNSNSTNSTKSKSKSKNSRKSKETNSKATKSKQSKITEYNQNKSNVKITTRRTSRRTSRKTSAPPPKTKGRKRSRAAINDNTNNANDVDLSGSDKSDNESDYEKPPRQKRKIDKNPLDRPPRGTSMTLRSSTKKQTEAAKMRAYQRAKEKADRARSGTPAPSGKSNVNNRGKNKGKSKKESSPTVGYAAAVSKSKAKRGRRGRTVATRGKPRTRGGGGLNRGRGGAYGRGGSSRRGRSRNGAATNGNKHVDEDSANSNSNESSSDGESSNSQSQSSNSVHDSEGSDEDGRNSNSSAGDSTNENKSSGNGSGSGSSSSSSGSETESEHFDHDENGNGANENDNSENENGNDENGNEKKLNLDKQEIDNESENGNSENENDNSQDNNDNVNDENDVNIRTYGHSQARESENEYELQSSNESDNESQNNNSNANNNNENDVGDLFFDSEHEQSSEEEEADNEILGTILGDENDPHIEYITRAEWNEKLKKNENAIAIFSSGSPMTFDKNSIPPDAKSALFSYNNKCVTVLHRALYLGPRFNGCILDVTVGDMPCRVIFDGDYTTRAKQFVPIQRNWPVKWLNTGSNNWEGKEEDVVNWDNDEIDKYHNYLLATSILGKSGKGSGSTQKRITVHPIHYGPVILHLYNRHNWECSMRRLIRLCMREGGEYDVPPIAVVNSVRKWDAQDSAVKDMANQLYINHWQRIASIVANIRTGKIDYNTCTIDPDMEWVFLPNIIDPKTARMQFADKNRKYVYIYVYIEDIYVQIDDICV